MTNLAILCVDDEPLVLWALRQELRAAFGERFAYESASSGTEGLILVDELIREGVRIILILSDWQMPGMKGDEFLGIVKDRHPEIPCALVTGHAEPESIRACYERGIIGAHLTKPWKKQDLVALVKSAAGS